MTQFNPEAYQLQYLQQAPSPRHPASMPLSRGAPGGETHLVMYVSVEHGHQIEYRGLYMYVYSLHYMKCVIHTSFHLYIFLSLSLTLSLSLSLPLSLHRHRLCHCHRSCMHACIHVIRLYMHPSFGQVLIGSWQLTNLSNQAGSMEWKHDCNMTVNKLCKMDVGVCTRVNRAFDTVCF